MTWSIADVARMSGVTSRTLRHYDEIGLLLPARIAAGGHRHYGEDELLRLQQILLMRELGLGLSEIAKVLDQQTDQVEALRAHHSRLLTEKERLGRLVETVERTITELVREGEEMSKINRPENLFEGFDHTQYDDEARSRWPQQWEESQRFVATLTPEDTERMQRESTAQMVRMAEFMVAGAAVDDPVVLTEVDLHYQGVCRFWTPNAEAYRGLGRMYTDDERFRANYESIAPGLAEYQRDAMAAYADARLS